jgi:hypothetical protein
VDTESVIEPQSGNSNRCELASSSQFRLCDIGTLTQFGQRKVYEQC